MSAVAVCTDSSALFPAGVAEALGIVVVPIAIALDGRSWDEREESVDDFYARMSNGAQVTTSQPSPAMFLETYAGLAEGGATEVLSIHLDARVSGTASTAAFAARDAPLPVTVVDTRTVSFGVGVCARAAAEAISSGASARGAASAATRAGARLRNAFAVHGGPSGRLPGSSEWAVLEFGEGRAAPVGAGGSVRAAIEAAVARVFDETQRVRVAVGHAAASTEPSADALAVSLEGLADVSEVERYRVGAAVGAHTGPLCFGAFWWPDSLIAGRA